MIATRATMVVLCAALAAGAAQAETTLRIGLTAMPPSLGNPYGVIGTTANFVVPAFYDRLAQFDNDGVLRPQLALSWRQRDALTWEFKLRPGVVFSNGERFTAAGAKRVLDYLRGPGGDGRMGAREPRALQDVIAEDELTLVVTTPQPNAVLPHYLYIVPFAAPEALVADGASSLATRTLGSGPFVAERWSSDRIVAKANRTSWRAPQASALEMIVLPEPTSRVQGLISGQIDVAIAVDPEQIEPLAAAGLRTAQRKPLRILSVVFDTLRPGTPFADARVRQAVNYGVNRAAIAATLQGGLVEPASQGALPGTIGYDDTLEPYPYDPAKARALLREAGYPDGFSFTLEMPVGSTSGDTSIMQQVAADLARIGVRMIINPVPFAQFSKYFVQGGAPGEALPSDYNLYGHDALRSFHGAMGTHGCGWSAPRFCDPVIQPVIEAAAAAPTLAERTALTKQVLKYHRDVAESLTLFPILGLDGLGPRVTHWETHGDFIQFHAIAVAD
ncbi:MAG: ABC transporter substrate-binding protein [Rhodospirillaceae bacterium]|nr:ABC transporter substrate-binding protein [Rhodospirillaceae bacterium]